MICGTITLVVVNMKEIFIDFDPNIKSTISKNIKRVRKARGLTQEQLALNAEISYDFMRRIESKKIHSGFSVVTLYKIACVLDISVDELMERNLSNVL